MTTEERGTGRSSKQLLSAYEKYGSFKYVIYPLRSEPYYKALLSHLKIPIDCVEFVGVDRIEKIEIESRSCNFIVDHHASDILFNSRR